MLLFASDLHLVGSSQKSTFDSHAFIRQIEQIVGSSIELGVENATLVLLGDIFELLKSEAWLDAGVRPWERLTEHHSVVVTNLFDDICSANAEFFDELRRLQAKYSAFHIQYIPGNHDRLMNTDAGSVARSRFRHLLRMEGSDSELFKNAKIDEEHRTIAKHGHEWDATNRYGASGAAIGDAVVIEILVKLPRLIQERMGLSNNDNFLKMISEIDNVRPQAPRYLAKWILGCLDYLAEDNSKGKLAVRESLEVVLQDFSNLRKGSTKFESLETLTWWERFLGVAARVCLKSFGALRSALLLPTGGESAGPYASFAHSDLAIGGVGGGHYSYILCGHTHVPEIVAIGQSSQKDSSRVYINTGTWRRVHHVAAEGGFVTWDEECIVTIGSPREQERLRIPAYEFRNMARGIEI